MGAGAIALLVAFVVYRLRNDERLTAELLAEERDPAHSLLPP